MVLTLFSSGVFAQGVYNNGAKIVVGPGAFFTVDGASGNYLNVTNGTDAAIALSGTLKLGGNYINDVAVADILSPAAPGSEVVLNGTGPQSLSGSSSVPFGFENLTISNGSGIQLQKDAVVNGVLSFNAGLLDIGAGNLSLTVAATTGGTPSASSMVVATGSGQMRKQFNAAGSFTFPVGDNTGTAEYSPVTLQFTSGTFAPGAYASVNLANAAYPDPYVITSYLNRYWNVGQSGITGFSCNAAFNYVPADVTGVENDIYCVRINPAPVTPYDPANVGLHRLTATGLTSFGTFTGALGIRFLNLTMFLEGLYNGGGTMRKAQGIAGDEFPGATADQIAVELHDQVTYSNVVYSLGNIDLSTTGQATVQVPATYSGSYYLTVRPRNSIATVSSAPLSLATPTSSYNFSTSASQAFGSNLKSLGAGVFGIYGGDSNADGVVDGLDLISVENDAAAFAGGYILTDLNGDGVVDGFDLIMAENNALNFISTIQP